LAGGGSSPGADILVAKLDASGSDLLYTFKIDSPVANTSHGIALDNADDIYITGGQNVPSELYVAKISNAGAPPPTSTPTPTPAPSNQPPVAMASAGPLSGPAPLTVQFSSDGSYDPEGATLTYTWNFGDGGSSTEPNPSYTYNAAGTYQANLTVTDNGGASQSQALAISASEATQSELHVQGQTVVRQTRGNRARGLDRLLITDQNNQPVAGPNQGQVSGVTGANGRVILSTDWVRRPQGGWCFEVTDVSKDGYVYDPATNVVTMQCESN
jgi:PKD repeat protein